jgi:hypothetical protein
MMKRTGTPTHGGAMQLNERQRRTDESTANAVARGMNILGVRNAELAKRYMEHKHVPAHVIARVIERPELRRHESTGQSVSEAITPSVPDDR